MKFIQYQFGVDFSKELVRPTFDVAELFVDVGRIMTDVKQNGDEAIYRYSQQFDGVKPAHLVIDKVEMERAASRLPVTLKEAIALAAANIRRFHKAQRADDFNMETSPGIMCSQRAVAIQRIGLYVPGGSAALFSSVLMLAIPAVLVGVETIVLATPPNADGQIPDAVLFAALTAGLETVCCVGGVQAIGAMTYGTETIPKVDKILGPGNQYVTAAKQLAFLQGVAIDMPAGPSEVAVIADSTANPAFVAADLLAQAEHGFDSQVVFICTDKAMVGQVQRELDLQLAELPRRAIAAKALENSFCVRVSNLDEALEVSNAYAPEHLILAIADADNLANRVINAGSVFLGSLTPESAGDYATGTNHTLPTNGAARAFSGVNTDAYLKKITFQKLSSTGVTSIGQAVVEMANAEGLFGHAKAMQLRLENVKSEKS